MLVKKKILSLVIVFIVCLSVSLFFFFNSDKEKFKKIKKWFILLDYNLERSLPKGELAKYDMAILDPDVHMSLTDFSKETILIAYISIGEAEDYRGYWKDIEGADWIIGRNPNWEGNYYVDYTDSEWQQLILEVVIPGIIEQEFKGLMLDTIDTYYVLENMGKVDAKKSMAEFIHKIHKTYPSLLLISNNGFDILEIISEDISGILTEDIFMMVDFDNDSYKKVPKEDSEYKLDILQGIQKKHNLPIFVIDYIPSDNRKMIEENIEKLKQLKFLPYIAEKNLDRIYEN